MARVGLIEALFLLFVCGAVLLVPLLGVVGSMRARRLFTAVCQGCGLRVQRSVRRCPRCGRER